MSMDSGSREAGAGPRRRWRVGQALRAWGVAQEKATTLYRRLRSTRALLDVHRAVACACGILKRRRRSRVRGVARAEVWHGVDSGKSARKKVLTQR